LSFNGTMDNPKVTIEDIRKALERIKKFVYRTPLYSNIFLSNQTGAEIFGKLECYQPTGVFKIRGAFNIELENYELIKKQGIVTASSGNHGLSVAYAARTLGVDCLVVVTGGANPDKIRMIRLYGAKVIEDGPASDSIIKKAREISEETGRFFVPPFDDPSVIAGQGTCGIEMFEDQPQLDTVIVSVGGGGLISGVSIALKSLSKNCKIVGVEAIGVPSLYESMKEGKLVTIENPKTIADGLLGQTIGKLNFEICRKNVDEVVLVSDDSMKGAVKSLLFDSHLLTEPSGAAPAAALLSGAYKPQPGEKIGLVVSGGNISYRLLQQLLNENYAA
jgi:threonine dehydratase